MRNKKIVFLLLLALSFATRSFAVLQEKSLALTLGVLKYELRNNYRKQKEMMMTYESNKQLQHSKLISNMKQCEQIGLMLYSQKTDFTFDIAYSCQQATRLHDEILKKENNSYILFLGIVRDEIDRYDSLIYALEMLPPAIGKAKLEITETDSLLIQISDTTNLASFEAQKNDSDENELELDDEPYFLTNEQQTDRDECLLYAKALKANFVRLYKSLRADKEHYENVHEKVEKLHNYAQQKYSVLQSNIFDKGNDNYFTILKNLSKMKEQMTRDFQEKYARITEGEEHSEWRGPGVLFSSVFMVFYIIVGAILSNIILRWVVPKRFRTESYMQKRPALIMALGILIFIIAMMIIRNVIDLNRIKMATGLMTNIAWLMQVVLISLLIRLKGVQIKYAVRMYMPFITMAFVVIMFRIILIPNSLLYLIFPPILLVCSFWQLYNSKKKFRKALPLSDKFYCGISLFVIIASTIISWAGWTLLSVQITIWWTFQLAVIQSITCIYDLLKMYENKVIATRIQKATEEELSHGEIIKGMENGEYIRLTWGYDLVRMALIPLTSVISFLGCIWASASVFEMTSICYNAFFVEFVNIEGMLSISIEKICYVVTCFFIFNYLNYALRSLFFAYKNSTADPDQEFNKTFAKNIIQILVWGTYFVSVLILLRVPWSGIEIIGAGLASGMGFASKDLLENFFYGISLMSGRARVGDWIECDGIVGKIESITYQSTQVVALDGSIIAFLNSALFSKNFRNLTRNHQYELNKIPVGVAYGTDVNVVREIILEALKPLCTKTDDGRDIVDPEKPLAVMFSDFGDSSVDLFVTCWVLVDKKGAFLAQAREIIYNVLNKNNVEIPFPQRDIHIRKD